jgi:hypothetical protein
MTDGRNYEIMKENFDAMCFASS